ncbi:Dolichol-phosphate mannosyltransferase subunit 1 [Halotydeus destructor]|nr:Dolichol-phosphate mannosyltransferase subunit 1 [Halotydeus destructor]
MSYLEPSMGGLVSLISALSVVVATLTLIIAIYNWCVSKYLSTDGVTTGPRVSVLLPARNEEDYLENCLLSLAHQDYDNYEILVMDDASTDKTYEIARALSRKYNRITVYQSAKLPEGWFGKAHAVDQLIRKATGDLILMTDADTVHRPNSIGFAVKNMADHECDFISGAGLQECSTLVTKFLLPTFWLMISFNTFSSKMLPRHPGFMLAMGSYICCKTQALDKVGRMASVRQSFGEDYALSLEFRRHGFKTAFFPIHDILTLCDRYEGGEKIYFRFCRVVESTVQENGAICLLFVPVFVYVYIIPSLNILSSIFLGSDLDMSCVYIYVASFFTQALFISMYGGVFNLFIYPIQASVFLSAIVHQISKSVLGKRNEWKSRQLLFSDTN